MRLNNREAGTMLTLGGWQDYLRMFLWAAALGAVGGLAYELLQSRRRQTGMFERPRTVGKGRAISYWDFGGFASLLIGAVAAVAALWVFPPEVVVKVGADGASETTRQWDVVKLVGLSLVIGSAGATFLGSLQARALALVKTEEAAKTKAVADSQLSSIADAANAGAGSEEVARLADAARKAVDTTSNGNPSADDI
jgi:hypothetical protein